jgi:AAA domain
MKQEEAVTITQFEPRRELLLASWLKRDLPPRDYLLGHLLSTTSRWLLFGDTGVGKTLVALDLAGAVAAGASFLNWTGSGKPRRVMYLDGEMPAETFKERMELVAKQYGPDLKLFGYNRDDLDGEMPPLNTEDGERWLWKEIEAARPDFIIFDSVMSLLTGTMADEESWAPVKHLMRDISNRRIAQVWLHHTGHDKTKSFGTKTREWEMDTVVSLTKVDDQGAISLVFKKARLRTPDTCAEFEPCVTRLGPDGWTIEEAAPTISVMSDGEIVRRAIMDAYDRLADGVGKTPGFDGAPVLKVKSDAIRDEVKSRGFLDKDDRGNLTAAARKMYERAKRKLLETETLIEADGYIWKLDAHRHQPSLHVT